VSHHVEPYVTDALAGEVHQFGAECFTCSWAAEAGDMAEADRLAQQHRDET
jgi:hypothetical protein